MTAVMHQARVCSLEGRFAASRVEFDPGTLHSQKPLLTRGFLHSGELRAWRPEPLMVTFTDACPRTAARLVAQRIDSSRARVVEALRPTPPPSKRLMRRGPGAGGARRRARRVIRRREGRQRTPTSPRRRTTSSRGTSVRSRSSRRSDFFSLDERAGDRSADGSNEMKPE
jgi:hypothetical protein